MDKTKQRPEFIQSLSETFKGNGTLLTVAAVSLIIISGVSIVDNRDNWWVTVLSISGFFLLTFLFMNARVVLKASIVSLLTLLLASGAFEIGTVLDTYGIAGLVWLGQVLFIFFSMLAYSYATNSGRSRWGLLGTTQVVAFIFTYILLTVNVEPVLAILAGGVLGILIFTISYKFFGKTKFARKNMPENILSDELAETLISGFETNGWNATPLPDKHDGGGILVWKDYAYYLYPIKMSSPFGDMGRKTPKLSYEGKNVNPWLLNIAFNKIPLWRGRGADITLVLLDLNSKNGTIARTIGAGLPDTKKKLPVGVIPSSKTTKSAENVSKLIKNIEDTLLPFKNELTEKQKTALSRIGKVYEDDETDDNIVEE